MAINLNGTGSISGLSSISAPAISGVPTGSASAPAFSFTGDSNTGIYSPGADQVAISTNGTGRLFVDSSGNVEIAGTGKRILGDFANATLANRLSFQSSGANLSTVVQAIPNGTATSGQFRAFNSSDPDNAGSGRLVVTTGEIAVESVTSGTGTHLPISFRTGGSARLTILTDGKVGIGGTPSTDLHVTNGSGARIRAGGAAGSGFEFNDANTRLDIPAANTIAAYTNNTERARIDSSGRLLVGLRSDITGGTIQAAGAVGVASVGDAFDGQRFANNANGPFVFLRKSRSGTIGAQGVVSSGDSLGGVLWFGSDGSNWISGARIEAEVDGTPGANDMPGRLIFATTADGASSPTERMRITQGGLVVIGNTTQTGLDISSSSATGTQFEQNGAALHVRNAQTALFVGRQTDDGNLVGFYQAGVNEGSISVSGTTVSYNGAHLSRWSQLPSGAERTEILRGSVLSNIDEMCEWGDEGNEQLNRMKVSDIEGDKNVSGVFQAWDDDDDTYTNDFYCAMTGDFIIRIGAGVTVERGDLLMSAGDGTAKPQDDDIIRSKTIAKVTSTNVSCTYPDGSYCVPCVLMAC